MIENSDADSPAAVEVLKATRVALSEAPATYGPASVLDVLLRRGARPEVRKVLLDASTVGAASTPGALRIYAAAVVALAYRRRLESIGRALIEAADSGPEAALTGQLDAAVAAVHRIGKRLVQLRGDVP